MIAYFTESENPDKQNDSILKVIRSGSGADGFQKPLKTIANNKIKDMDKLTITIREPDLIEAFENFKKKGEINKNTYAVKQLLTISERYKHKVNEYENMTDQRDKYHDKYLRLVELVREKQSIENQINHLIK